MFYRFLTDEEGATAIEYALIASLISIAIITALQSVSTANEENWNKINSAISTASGG